jgi:hypothetical protein
LASTVYTVEEVVLGDDTTVTLKPLMIKPLREFMKRIDDFGEAKTEEAGLDILLDSGAICLKSQRPEFWDDEKTTEVVGEDGEKKVVKTPGYSDKFEEVMDMETLYKVLEVCGGVKLNDPNLIRAAAEALGQN